MDAADAYARNMVRSCTACSKAKAKCVRKPGEGVGVCERCARLKKECHAKEAVVRRRKPIKTTRAAQLEKLESKIEHLVNTLSHGQIPSTCVPPALGRPAPPVSLQASSITDRAGCSFTRTSDVLRSLCEEGCASPSTDANPSSVTTSANLQLERTNTCVRLSEAESLLDRFRRLMATGMPFVIIPAEATASSLQSSSPVLLRSICTIALVHDLPRQQALVKELVRDVAERIMVKSEKSIDLLQSILMVVAWYHSHVFWSLQVTNLLHLAIAMIIDLGIDRSPSATVDFKAKYVKAVHGPPLATRVPSLAERRVVQGVFYLTSMLSSSFRKIDAMPYTNYMEECLDHLEQAKEYDSDILLVQIVRVQRVIEAIHTTDSPSAPPRIYIKAFQADIERLRKADPYKKDDVFLSMQYLTAEILIWELSLNDLQDNKTHTLSSHLEDLYNCVESIKQFLDAYFLIPSSAYLLLPFSVFGQFAHAFIVLTKLASLELEGWDLKALNDQLSFSEVIDECASRFEAAAHATTDGIVIKNESFTLWAQRVKFMEKVYQQKFTSEATNKALAQEPDKARAWQTPTNAGQPTPPEDPVLSTDFFNYLDENFWQTFAGFTGDFDLQLPDMTTA
ncbi:hypothetical protein DOTSEDRAFT_68225 [Dothistroma septosporum NZE10]|uniref:GATA-type domain-containing protein n=1 Tax=Dothistroma septosporum (strain NZE10 / CBS 128990) TaxID=675120 RepID=N1Q116_DOTSN|nr:hypothetical protein DOTSEDRAFT_68225 [Dothistroma septosporum NZE10]